MNRPDSKILLSSQRKKIVDLGYEPRNIDLTNEEREILVREYIQQVSCTPIIESGSYSGCSVTKRDQKDYIGYISLPSHIIRLNPKINILNISYMFQYAYNLQPFRDEEIEYLVEKENTMFELLVKKLLDMTKKLCREGIVKSYNEYDENLPYVKGKIHYKENAIHNLVLKHRVYCRYDEFGPDNTENRIIKHTLYSLTFMELNNDLHRELKFLLPYFDSVSLKHFDYERGNDVQKIKYTKLTMRYKPVIDLCRLLMTKSTISLSRTGEFRFSSFLEDMNKLFELFIFGLVSSRIKESLIGKYKETIVITANEGDSKKEGDPDILVGKGNGRWSVVIDAKYKREVKNMDLYQIWTYAIALGLQVGILVYPKDTSTNDYEIILRNNNTRAHILTIDLDTSSHQGFKKECNRFISSLNRVNGIEDVLEQSIFSVS